VEAIKTWARSLFLLSIFSSTVLMIVPKSMQKQSRFVAEMLLLLCVMAPLAGLLSSGSRASLLPSEPGSSYTQEFSLGKFHAGETARRVTEIAERAGIPVESVKVTTGDAGFSLVEVVVYLSDRPADETLRVFRETLGAYLGIRKDRLRVIAPGATESTGP
jgi:hypothetical protein